MSSNFRFILIQDNTKTTFVVRKAKKTSISNYSPVMDALNFLGLEKVPYTELVPKYKQIKKGDCLLEQTCSICYDNYNLNEYKRELFCQHVFHKKCIDKWLKNNLSCPMCRQDIGDIGDIGDTGNIGEN
jgi:hypothetical protein